MSDALDRLRNRNRPTVPARDASLTSTAPVAPVIPIAPIDSISQDTSTSRYQRPETPKLQDTSTSRYQRPETPKLQDSRHLDSEPPLQTKQSTMRLEQGLSDRLQEVCRANGISREVLIEALFEYSEAHPEMLKEVLIEANAKNEHRQQIANLKRARSMMEKFGQ